MSVWAKVCVSVLVILHDAPLHFGRHVHTHAVKAALDVVEDAWLWQWTVLVHSTHVGYVMYPTAHLSHVRSAKPTLHVHTHASLATFDVTDAALLLQCVADVHWVHVGYVI